MYFKVVEQAPVVLQSNHLLHLWVGDLEVGSRPTTHPPEQYGDPYLPFQAVMGVGTRGIDSKILGEVESGEFVDSLEVGGEERAKVKTTKAPSGQARGWAHQNCTRTVCGFLKTQ